MTCLCEQGVDGCEDKGETDTVGERGPHLHSSFTEPPQERAQGWGLGVGGRGGQEGPP